MIDVAEIGTPADARKVGAAARQSGSIDPLHCEGPRNRGGCQAGDFRAGLSQGRRQPPLSSSAEAKAALDDRGLTRVFCDERPTNLVDMVIRSLRCVPRRPGGRAVALVARRLGKDAYRFARRSPDAGRNDLLRLAAAIEQRLAKPGSVVADRLAERGEVGFADRDLLGRPG